MVVIHLIFYVALFSGNKYLQSQKDNQEMIITKFNLKDIAYAESSGEGNFKTTLPLFNFARRLV